MKSKEHMCKTLLRKNTLWHYEAGLRQAILWEVLESNCGSRLFSGSQIIRQCNCKRDTCDGAARYSRDVKRLLEATDNSAAWNNCFMHGESFVRNDIIPSNVIDVLKEA